MLVWLRIEVHGFELLSQFLGFAGTVNHLPVCRTELCLIRRWDDGHGHIRRVGSIASCLLGQVFPSCLPSVRVEILGIVLLIGRAGIWFYVVDARVAIEPQNGHWLFFQRCWLCLVVPAGD